ncbi:MAG: hydrogenase maturation protease [Methanomassiliicoccaceae archaeon]|jgi:hydrogenase maturation protease|nr:hydrogenase maturation protease [Methanomassiliicoccaceae archaeon]
MEPVGRLSENVVVIGLGSPIMTDDAIGLRVAEIVGSMALPNVDTMQEAIGGLDIIPLIMGYRNAVIVDAIKTNAVDPGTIIIFDPEDFEPTVVNASAHEMNLATAIRIGRQYDPEGMPDTIRFVAVEVSDIMTVGETMTPEVEAALPEAVDTVMKLIDELQRST